ncbi:hypothetical protein DM02DRAFT_632349 [Periconia macrospinosa]|uniref:Uncharacterized protein n=1 Tax=Periconia macrospinosa TaxID=97972 RepID=A0A2V1DFZ8_9PLEO|nr:hypothetical protein DM02DRAFT_632349 [Periconia macrospinosa]
MNSILTGLLRPLPCQTVEFLHLPPVACRTSSMSTTLDVHNMKRGDWPLIRRYYCIPHHLFEPTTPNERGGCSSPRRMEAWLWCRDAYRRGSYLSVDLFVFLVLHSLLPTVERYSEDDLARSARQTLVTTEYATVRMCEQGSVDEVLTEKTVEKDGSGISPSNFATTPADAIPVLPWKKREQIQWEFVIFQTLHGVSMSRLVSVG